MAFNLPLPTMDEISIPHQLGVLNALQKQSLENRFYAPNIQSQIGYRNALTQGQDITNQYLPDKLRLANEHQGQVNQLYVPDTNSQIGYRNALTKKIDTMTPIEAQKAQEELKWYDKMAQANINYKNMGGSKGGVAQKDLNAFTRQLEMDNPQRPDESIDDYDKRIGLYSDAYGSGETALPTGEQLPPLSWKAQQLQNSIMNRNIPVAARNQLLQLDNLVTELKDYDIESVKAFAGPQGRARLIQARAKMALNPNDPTIDPLARRYISSINQSILNMDAMRKAYGTTVVPEYVTQTLGKLANPNDTIWNDPKQVEQNFNATLRAISKTKDLLQNKYRRGITASSKESKDQGKDEKSKKPDLRYNQQTGEFEEVN